jgi:hypothetical protein
MLVSLWAAGAIDIVAALSFINILLVVVAWVSPCALE